MAGKARSSKNAIRHGVLSRDAVLPDEDAAAFAGFCDEFSSQLEPQDCLEEVLVGRIAVAAWRLGRVHRIEASMFAHRMAATRAIRAREEARAMERSLCSSRDATQCEQRPLSAGCTHDVPVQLLESRGPQSGFWWCVRGSGRRRHGLIRQSRRPRVALAAGGLGGRPAMELFDAVHGGRTVLWTGHPYAPRQFGRITNRSLP